jgi:peptide/nickel transport system substrate-binding protein
MMQPVPVQDIARLAQNANLKVADRSRAAHHLPGDGPGARRAAFSNIKGKNPFKDKRVRQAFYQAIDIEAIKTRIMRGAAKPTALMIGPGNNGFTEDLNKRLPYDPEACEEAAGRCRLSRAASRSR